MKKMEKKAMTRMEMMKVEKGLKVKVKGLGLRSGLKEKALGLRSGLKEKALGFSLGLKEKEKEKEKALDLKVKEKEDFKEGSLVDVEALS